MKTVYTVDERFVVFGACERRGVVGVGAVETVFDLLSKLGRSIYLDSLNRLAAPFLSFYYNTFLKVPRD
jgi:hypothetical protein